MFSMTLYIILPYIWI